MPPRTVLTAIGPHGVCFPIIWMQQRRFVAQRKGTFVTFAGYHLTAAPRTDILIRDNNRKRLMKTMTCKQLGGKCDQKLSADTWDEMVKAMTTHVMDKHPDVAKDMEAMYKEDPKKWGKEMKPKWDVVAED